MKQNLPQHNPVISNSSYHSTIRKCYFVVLILCLALTIQPAQAQLTKVWETPPFTHSSGAGKGFVKQVKDGAGNLIILGTDLTLYKYDATGKQLWTAKFEPEESYLPSNAGLWLDKSDNSYVLWGNVLVKYSPAGNLLWNKSFSDASGMTNVTALTLDADGNVYVTGGSSAGNTQKYAATGELLWSATTSGETIAVDNKGGVYVATSSSSLVQGYESIVLVKYNAATGAELMRQKYDTPRIPGYNETAKKIMITNSGDIYILVNKEGGYNGSEKQVFFYKTTPTGTLIYKKSIGKTDEAMLFDAVFAANEDIIVLGRLLKYRITWDHFMTRVNANADHVWYHTFNVYEANNMVRYFAPSSNNGMAVKADGSITIAGSYSFLKVTQMAMPEVYTEYPKLILATFTKDGKETWRQVMDHNTSREGSAGVSLIDDKSLYFAGTLTTLPSFNSPVNLVAMKYQDCSGFTASAGADKQLCEGGSAQLQASGGVTYSWAPATGLSAANIANPVASPATTTTYTVTVTNAEGCTAADQVVVTVEPGPTASISANGPTTICQGSTIILTANSRTGYTYQWLRNGSVINQATGNTYTASTTGDYAVVVKNSSGCSATSTFIKVTVAPGVTASAGADKEICAGESIQLTATAGTTYSWSPATGLSATNIANPIASPATTTTYTVTVSNANGCSATDQVIVKVNAAPVASITPVGATIFCEGASVVLNATQGAGYTYQWLKDGNPINQATGSSFTTFAEGSFTVRVTNGSCTITSAPVIVTVNKPATVNAGTSQSVCANAGAVTLTGFSPAGGAWTGTGVTTAGVFTPATAGVGTHTLTYTVTQNGCTATATKTVTVQPAVATPGIISGDASVCAGTTNLTYSIAAVSNADTYTWTVPQGFTITAGHGTTSIKVTSGSTSGSITVKATNDCGTSAASSITVSTTAQPAVSITAQGNTTFCEGGVVVLKATTGSDYTYQWLRNGNAITGATAAEFNATTSGNYTVRVNNGNCIVTSSEVSVTTTSGISNNSIATGNQTVCVGMAVPVLQGSTPAGGAGNYTYQWERSTDGTTFSAIQGATSSTYAPGNLNTTTWFRRKVTAGDCNSISAAIKVTVATAPTVSLTAFEKMCTDDEPLTLTGGQPGGGTYSGTGVTNGIFDAATAGAGTHTITYTYTGNGGCTAIATQTIEVEANCDVTGVEDDEPPHKFEYFPNPAKNKLNVAVELPDKTDITIQLVDARGRIVHQQAYQNQVGAFADTILLENKARGMYFLRFTTKDGTYNRKVLLW
ncbi:T9SS type A sorting domain-containing protein [Pontibacter sp. H259]|uniref:Ig-like domain-containing protein n=1 Tax=Pontibacter sp. H259 TaxID=3133421 RepID=UPI0030C59215